MIVLYFLFLSQNIIDSIGDTLPLDQVKFLVYSDVMGGILIVSIIGSVQGGLNTFVMDQYEDKLQGFLVTPINRTKLSLAYVISAVISSFIITLVLWIFVILYIGFASTHFFSLTTIFLVPVILLGFTILTAMILILPMSLFTTPSATGPFMGILGTFIGFMCGIYMPLSNYGKGMNFIAGILPFTHMQVFLKRVMINDSVKLIGIPKDYLETIWDNLGASYVNVFGINLPVYGKVIYILIFSLILMVLSIPFITKKIKK
jgi:multidrug/hemolysin transport system permease protein